MIVGTIQQEDDCSWQDASKSWLEQDEKEEVGIYQVGTCQDAGGAPLETGEGAASCPPTRERGDAKVAEDGWWAPGPGDLLIEGEEGEYFLKLLMREASPEESNPTSSKVDQPAREKGNSKRRDCPRQGQRKKEGQEEGP